MSTKFIPMIPEDSYESFKRILDVHLPETYDQWLYLTAKRSLENVAMGNTSEPVETHFDEFIRYCRTVADDPDLNALHNFAYQKGMRNKY
jgi:hypothetical protein